MDIKKLAAIDIGSDGVRLLISSALGEVDENPKFTKASLVRASVRLGTDVLIDKLISSKNTDRLADAMEAPRLLMKVNQVKAYRACAASAIREATNGQAAADEVLKRAGVQIDITDGSEEAEIIVSTGVSSLTKSDKSHLYIDVGGDSTEFAAFSNGEMEKSRSFPIGTVRLLDNKVNDKTWKEVREWIEKRTADCQPIEAVGSGGNINKIHKDSSSHGGDPLTYEHLTDYYAYVPGYTYDGHTRLLGFNPDRVGVILYTLAVSINAMRWSRAPIVHVPRVGLAGGTIKTIYNKENQ